MGVDATRGVALLGMIAVHSLWAYDATGQPTWSYTVFGGRASAAFAVLAGVGIAFTTGRQRVHVSAGPATAAALGARALVIGAIGLMLGYTDASLATVILPYYAMMFVLAIPLVFLPTWAVAVIGVATAGGMPMLSHILRPNLPEPNLDNPTIGYLVTDPIGILTELSLTGVFPALPWMAYLCAGLVVGRLKLTRTLVATALFATGTVLAVAASAASSILLNRYGGLAHIQAAQPNSELTAAETTELLAFGSDGTTPTSTWWWLAVDAPHTSTTLDILHTTGTAIALLGLMLLASHLARPALRGLAAVVQAPLAGAGAMTLTFYTTHIMFINSDYDNFDATTGYLLQVAVALIVGLIWRASMARGPLEALTAMLTTHARRWATPTSRNRRPNKTAVTAKTFTEKAMGADDVNDKLVDSSRT